MIKKLIFFLENFLEIIGWIQIVVSPLLFGLVIGSIVYISMPTTTGLIIGISIASLGLILGIIWAIKTWKTKGTVWFMSRIMATPELDKEETKNERPPNF